MNCSLKIKSKGEVCMWQKIRPVLIKLAGGLKQYWWIVVIILLAYAAYKTFFPSIKIIEKTETVVDTVALDRAKTEIVSLNNTIADMRNQVSKLKKINKDIQSDIVIVEIKYPDGRVEKRTEKKIKDNSTTVISSTSTTVGSSSSVTSSTSSTVAESTTTVHSQGKTDITAQKNPVPLWTSYFGYMIRDRNCMIGQGININENITVGIMSAYDTEIAGKDIRWDYGGMLLLRY